ncbi:MAG: YXWGXW repeat-containing protein [Deltaproteobacteria bacterium]|nr:YXWGXW repeat-containing protein [Deltaproteobacteria bacterium]
MPSRDPKGAPSRAGRWARRLASVLAVAALGCASTPRSSGADGYWVGELPPEPYVESIPPPMSGYAWVPGYWELSAGMWIWVPGRLYPLAYASNWIPPRCTPHRGSCWYVPGHWDPARDPRPRKSDSRPRATAQAATNPHTSTSLRPSVNALGRTGSRTPRPGVASTPSIAPRRPDPRPLAHLNPQPPMATQATTTPALVPNQPAIVPPSVKRQYPGPKKY